MQKLAFMLYKLGWRAALPLLKRNPRLKEGYAQRIFDSPPQGPADIWIQAASAGEAYLADTLVHEIAKMDSARHSNILVTTNTRQGMDILLQTKAGIEKSRAQTKPAAQTTISLELAFFPFDQPAIMDSAVRHVAPKVMVLLETEIWPGLLSALRRHKRRVVIVNGRMTEKSLKGYEMMPGLWPELSPDRVLAVSRADADRFARLFGKKRVDVMANIKFDRVRINPEPAGAETDTEAEAGAGTLGLPAESPFVVLGSIRQEEEADVGRMIRALLHRRPELVIGLFPRHMHRLPAWQQHLSRMEAPGPANRAGQKGISQKRLNWTFRSRMTEAPVLPGSLVLWDCFGELAAGYAHADAVFVGGSLAPLGGQNFLEPLMHGRVPVIGPSWENFAWVGPEVFSRGLVRRVENWQSAAAELIRQIEAAPPRNEIKRAAAAYIAAHQGGTRQACQRIAELLAAGEKGTQPS